MGRLFGLGAMMPRIMRWKGGYAGDMIMRMMQLSGHRIANVRYLGEISDAGRVIVDFSHTSGPLSQIQRIALAQRFRDHVDLDQLTQEITSAGNVWIKSHDYNQRFDDITTDIMVDAASLPFMLYANISKTETLMDQKFHALARKVQDPVLHMNLAFYNVGRDSIDTVVSSSCQITVSHIIAGWDALTHCLDQIDIAIDPSCRQFYNGWQEKNRRYFPSDVYRHMIESADYDWHRSDLPLAERYALLVLSGERFRNLT